MNIKSTFLLMSIFEVYINADQSENDLNYLKTNADKLDVWKHSDHFPFQRFRVPKQDQQELGHSFINENNGNLESAKCMR